MQGVFLCPKSKSVTHFHLKSVVECYHKLKERLPEMGAFFFGKGENMTVQKLYVKNKYYGDGANTVFPITFEWAKKHPESIQVWVRNNAGVLTKTDNFLLKTSSNEDIWNVVYPSVGDPLGQGETITIVRELSLLQVLNLVNQGPFFAEDVEITFDELVMMIQQLNEKLARSFKVAVDIDGENTFDTTVPIEPGKSFRVKDDGTGFEVTEDPAQVLPLAKSELEAVKREHAEAVQDLTVIKDEVESAKTDAQSAANVAVEASRKVEYLKDSYVTAEEFYQDVDDNNWALAINRAINYASENNLAVMLGGKTYEVKTPIVLKTDTVLYGVSNVNTVIKLADGANCNVMETENFDVLYDNRSKLEEITSVSHPYNIRLSNFVIDGNRQNNTSKGNGIALCSGATYLKDITIKQVRQTGLLFGFIIEKLPYKAGESTTQASCVENVRVFTTGEHGIYNYLGNDTHFYNVVVADASMNNDKTYDLIRLAATARLINVHPWSSTPTLIPTVARYALALEKGVYEIIGSHIEGGGVCSLWIGENSYYNKFSTTHIYASRGETICDINSNQNIFSNCSLQKSSSFHNDVCLKLAPSSSRNTFDFSVFDELPSDCFGYDSEVGCNKYNIVTYSKFNLGENNKYVKNLQFNSSLKIIPRATTIGDYNILNTQRDLKVTRRIVKTPQILADWTGAQPIGIVSDEIIVLSANGGTVALNCKYSDLYNGAGFSKLSIRNLSDKTIQVWGSYVDVAGVTRSNFNISPKTEKIAYLYGLEDTIGKLFLVTNSLT